MAKRKTKKKAGPWQGFSFGKAKKTKARGRGKKAAKTSSGGLRAILVIFAVIVVLAGGAAGFMWLEGYVGSAELAGGKSGPLELINPPGWMSEELSEAILSAAGGGSFALDKNTAHGVAQNLQSLPWLYDIRVRTSNETVLVAAKYRKPVAMVKQRKEKYYVAEDMMVLRSLAVSKLAVIEVKGFSRKEKLTPGQQWRGDDIAAAVKLLRMLGKMDDIASADKPLLNEIASVDVSNLGGRRSSRQAHIVLNAKDNTKIFWGAEPGSSQRYMEPVDKDKIAALYEFYKTNGTVQGKVKYIELRQP